MLAARGVELLDQQTVAAMELHRLNRRVPARAARRLLAGQVAQSARLGRSLQNFQRAVLGSLYQQAGLREAMPPQPTGRYEVAFTVLEHDLPAALWPDMNHILAQHVQLWVRDAAGVWSQVKLSFQAGSDLVFSRRYLEQAFEMKLTKDGKTLGLFEITHERTP